MGRRRGGAGTLAVHAGEGVDPETGAVVGPIVQSATFAYPLRPTPDGAWAPAAWFYTRYGNPTVAAVERKVAALEGAPGALAFASGMGAMAAAVFGLVRAGERVAAMQGVYGGTQALLANQAPGLGLGVDTTPAVDAGALADLVVESTRLVVTEIPTNPFNRVLDLPDLGRRLERRWGRARPRILTDATFATPLNLRSIERGADLSHHSATKYLNGHADVVGGVVSGREADLRRLESWRRTVGAAMDPHQAFLLGRGLKTLHVRVRRAEANASEVAEVLERHAKVGAVWHLSRPSHPDHRLARRLLGGPGAVVTFELRRASRAAARRFLYALNLFVPAPSLGGVESLASLPIETSHAGLSPAARRLQGITPGTVRLAVGIEDAKDLVDDLRRALRRV